MEKVTRRFETCEDLFEAIIAAHKRHSNIHVILPTEIVAAVNEASSAKTPIMNTRIVGDNLDKRLILNFRIPEQEEMEFDVDSVPYGTYNFSVDFSKETDYCGMY